MISVVIAAHNEGAVIADCLDALLSGPKTPGDQPEIVVVANGCTDDTVERASSRAEINVIEIVEASKPAALNAGDQVASGFPRIYLDADILVPSGGLAALAATMTLPDGPLAAAPKRRLNTVGRPWPVRAYFAISERLPAFQSGLIGRGMIGLSEIGRRRFGAFPNMLADDLFLDSVFTSEEKVIVSDVEVTVETSWRTKDLVRRLARVRRANADMRAAARSGTLRVNVRAADRWAWLRTVVLPDPRLAPAALVYVFITAWAALRARRTRNGEFWGRDESTRSRTLGPEAAQDAR
jgi:glycosyltransferase involved in cell wall biosynthesis